MAHLYKHLRIHQVFGANTDVGKTVLTTALCRAAAASARRVYFLKPLSTGHAADADDGHILRHAGPLSERISADCLYRYGDPVSPHLAAQRDQSQRTPSDAEFVRSISNHIKKCAEERAESAMFVETAGGVHSPTLLGTLQADAYRPLLLPTVLIADPRLGGISSTISAYESMVMRGYSIDLVLCMFDQPSSKAYLNHEFLTPWFAERGIPVCAPPPPPAKSDNDRTNMEAYYTQVTDGPGEIQRADQILTNAHHKRIETLKSMPRRATKSFWWPFVQHDFIKNPEKDITTIDSAHRDSFSVHSSNATGSLLKPHLDGSASWWTQSFGHSHHRLALAAAQAAGRYGHVIFPLAVHQPALDLAERLVNGPGAGWADRVFFSDDGSTAVEVALKMAVRAVALRRQQGTKTELGVLGIKGSYHGDTIGAMDACEGGVYNASVEWHRERGFWFDPPTVGVHDGVAQITVPKDSGAQKHTFSSVSAIYDIGSRLKTPLAGAYRKHIRAELERLTQSGRTFGALVIEPIVLGAGGMLFVDPLFQRILVDTVRESSDLFKTGQPKAHGEWVGLPIIFDEVFTGFHRIGPLTPASMLETTPDIGVYAKILTGGVVPLSATLTTESIFSAFNFPGAKKIDALLHGHSYSAHPVGCAVASATMDEIKVVAEGKEWQEAKKRCSRGLYASNGASECNVWTLWDPSFIENASKSKRVEQTMALGTVFAMTLRGAEGGYQATIAQDFITLVRNQLSSNNGEYDLHARTLGDVVYFMSSLNTRRDTLQAIEKAVLAALEQHP
ncbi:adenosylmethionine-8-amino-7-oxononanoate aminotransferase [Rhizoctonia solani 123E]|uniref:Adenosylmethionine-8-amino-7-oxononanoate aminotransferase n=1 Tax=Rhizoctonia solani 123E TaxID=1423351 RepID=A0A074RZ69_9AGAM|nr:adenosylmethionine-8-amino-7-oxononanoate aminotransferase [Rhizoctonia solani 123E]